MKPLPSESNATPSRIQVPSIDDMSEEERIEFLARRAVYSAYGESNENTERVIADIIAEARRRQ